MKTARRFAIGQKLSPAEAMRIAIHAGRRGTGLVSPNPLVGCVILDRDFKLISVGHHARDGGDHAEIAAVKNLGDPTQVQGAHVFVTLEPCAHQGRTGSCARALAKLRPTSVTYAIEDPHPLVSGQGAVILREARIEALKLEERDDVSPEEKESLRLGAETLAEIFLHNQRTRKPFVAVKVASTLDGQMAMASGESKWITGDGSLSHAHLIRARYDGVAVGKATFDHDDPSLNVRHERFPNFENKAIVLDPDGKILERLENSNILRVRRPENVIVVVGKEMKTDSKFGERILPVTINEDSFVIDEFLDGLGKMGVWSLMIEGGARTIGLFLRARAVQRLHVYLAPSLLGGKGALSWSSGFGVKNLDHRLKLENSKRKIIGGDLYWTAQVRY